MSDVAINRDEVVYLLRRHHRPLSARRLLMLINQEYRRNLNYGQILSALRRWSKHDRQQDTSSPLVELRKGVFALIEQEMPDAQELTSAVHRDQQNSSSEDEKLALNQVKRSAIQSTSPILLTHEGRTRPQTPITREHLENAERLSGFLAPYPPLPVHLEDVLSAKDELGDHFNQELIQRLYNEVSLLSQALSLPWELQNPAAETTRENGYTSSDEALHDSDDEPLDELSDEALHDSDDEPLDELSDEVLHDSDELSDEALHDSNGEPLDEALHDLDDEPLDEALHDSDDEPLDEFSDTSSTILSLEEQGFVTSSLSEREEEILTHLVEYLVQHAQATLDELATLSPSHQLAPLRAQIEVQKLINTGNHDAIKAGKRPPFILNSLGIVSLSTFGMSMEMIELEKERIKLNERYQQAFTHTLINSIRALSPAQFESLLYSWLLSEGYQDLELLNRRDDGKLAMMAHHATLTPTLIVAQRHDKALRNDQLGLITRSLKGLFVDRAIVINLAGFEMATSDPRLTLINGSDFTRSLTEREVGVFHYHTTHALIDEAWFKQL